MTESIILSKFEGSFPTTFKNSSLSSLENYDDFDRRTPQDHFFEKINAVNSGNFLPQISNLSSSAGPCLVSGRIPQQDELNSEDVAKLVMNRSTSVPCPSDCTPSVHSLEHSTSTEESTCNLAHGDEDFLLTSPVMVETIQQEATTDTLKSNSMPVPCPPNNLAKNLRKKRRGGKKKTTTGRQNLRSTSRRSKRGGRKLGNIAAAHDKNKIPKNDDNFVLNCDSNVGVFKLSSNGLRRVYDICTAGSTRGDRPMGQRASRVIRPLDAAKDEKKNDAQDLLALYSKPIQVSQKERPVKKVVTMSTPLFVPKPPKVKKMVLNDGIQRDASPKRSVGASVDIGDYIPYRASEEQYNATRGLARIYLSERQSGTIKLLGQLRPGAPPATPTPAQLANVIYIPSMNDVKAQREFKMRLEVLDHQEKKRQEKIKKENIRKEMNLKKERVETLKKMQRLQIYALNEVMTKLENERFEKFKQKKEKLLERDLDNIR